MRLIDADALKKDGWRLRRYVSGDGYSYEDNMEIDRVPTIEARPVVRGEWLGDHGGYTCSNCGGDAPDESYWASPFCAACGADMRPKEESEDAGN